MLASLGRVDAADAVELVGHTHRNGVYVFVLEQGLVVIVDRCIRRKFFGDSLGALLVVITECDQFGLVTGGVVGDVQTFGNGATANDANANFLRCHG